MSTTRYYYAGQSDHGSESSHGFANDWTVYVFDSRTSRDKFVESSRNLSTIALKRRDVTGYATNENLSGGNNAPRPFHGEFWAICNTHLNAAHQPGIPGLVGEIAVACCDGDPSVIDRLYRGFSGESNRRVT